MGRVVVVGGGISGLAAAWELSGGVPTVVRDRVDIPARRRARQREVRRSHRRYGSRRLPRTAPRSTRPLPRDRAGRCTGPDRRARRRRVGARARAPASRRPGPGHPDPVLAGRPVGHPRSCGASSDWPATRCSPVPTCAAPSATAPSARSWRASSANGWPTVWWIPSSAASTPVRWTTCRPPRPIHLSWRRPRREAA